MPRSDVIGPDGTPKRPFPLAPVVWSCPSCAELERFEKHWSDSEEKRGYGQSAALLPVELAEALLGDG